MTSEQQTIPEAGDAGDIDMTEVLADARATAARGGSHKLCPYPKGALASAWQKEYARELARAGEPLPAGKPAPAKEPPKETTTAAPAKVEKAAPPPVKRPRGMEALEALQEKLIGRRPEYAALLPREVPVDSFIANAVAYVIQNPALLDESQYDRPSLMRAIMETARLGLMPHGIIPGCHLVGFWNTKLGKREVVPITDYRALVDLAIRSGIVESVKVMPIFEADHFVYTEGIDTRLEHSWPFDLSREQRGAFRGAYAVFKLTGGGTSVFVMNYAELSAIRDGLAKRNKGRGAGVWDDGLDGFVAMSLKTVARRGLNLIPKSAARLTPLTRALEVEETVEREPAVDPRAAREAAETLYRGSDPADGAPAAADEDQSQPGTSARGRQARERLSEEEGGAEG